MRGFEETVDSEILQENVVRVQMSGTGLARCKMNGGAEPDCDCSIEKVNKGRDGKMKVPSEAVEKKG